MTLSGFTPNSQTGVYFNNTTVPTYSIDFDPFYYLGSSGGVDEAFDPIFEHISAGTYEFSANDPGTGETFSASYTVTSGNTTLVPTPAEGCSGASISVSGSGFYDSSPFSVYLGPVSGSPGYEYLSGGTVDESGDIATGFTVPALPSGDYTLFAEDGVGNYAATPFSCTETAVPTLTLNPASGPMHAPLEAIGANFAPDSSISVTVTPNNGAPVVDCTYIVTNASGGFTCTFVIPASEGATYDTVLAEDAADDQASTVYTVVAPTLVLSTNAAQPGTTLWVNGTGFAQSSPTTATLDGTGVVCTASTSITGTLSCAVVVPLETPELITISVEDSSYNEATAPFTILSLPTSEFPAYILSVRGADSHPGKLAGVQLDGVQGFLLNNWSFGRTLVFHASTNLTSQSRKFYNDAVAGDLLDATLTAFVLGPDPNSTEGAITVIQEASTVTFEKAYSLDAQISGGSGETPIVTVALGYAKLLYGSVPSAVPEPTGPFPVDLISISPNGDNPESNPITIDGVSGSWSYSWWLSSMTESKVTVTEFNATVVIPIGNEWLNDAVTGAKTTFILYEISSPSGPIALELKIIGHSTKTSPFMEWASAGVSAELSETVDVSTVDWIVGP